MPDRRVLMLISHSFPYDPWPSDGLDEEEVENSEDDDGKEDEEYGREPVIEQSICFILTEFGRL